MHYFFLIVGIPFACAAPRQIFIELKKCLTLTSSCKLDSVCRQHTNAGILDTRISAFYTSACLLQNTQITIDYLISESKSVEHNTILYKVHLSAKTYHSTSVHQSYRHSNHNNNFFVRPNLGMVPKTSWGGGIPRIGSLRPPDAASPQFLPQWSKLPPLLMTSEKLLEPKTYIKFMKPCYQNS